MFVLLIYVLMTFQFEKRIQARMIVMNIIRALKLETFASARLHQIGHRCGRLHSQRKPK